MPAFTMWMQPPPVGTTLGSDCRNQHQQPYPSACPTNSGVSSRKVDNIVATVGRKRCEDSRQTVTTKQNQRRKGKDYEREPKRLNIQRQHQHPATLV